MRISKKKLFCCAFFENTFFFTKVLEKEIKSNVTNKCSWKKYLPVVFRILQKIMFDRIACVVSNIHFEAISSSVSQ